MFDAQKQVIRGSIEDSLSNIKAIEINPADIRYARVAKNGIATSGCCVWGAVVMGIGLIFLIADILEDRWHWGE